MSGQYTADRFAGILEEHGETMVLERAGEGTTITLKGKRKGGRIEETGNTAVQQTFEVKIAPTALLASAWADKVPKHRDKILVGSRKRSVLDAEPLSDSGVLCGYVLTVSG